MTEKIVMGRFRENLALIFSILALAISLVVELENESGRGRVEPGDHVYARPSS